MKLDRGVFQGGFHEAQMRVEFCLDQLEKADEFKNGITMESDVVTRCTMEEIIGALVSAEQALQSLSKEES